MSNMEENVYQWKSCEDFKLLLDKVLETECGSSLEKHSDLTSILNKVIKLKDIECLQLLLERAPYLTEEKNTKGLTPLLNVLESDILEVNSGLLTVAQVLLQTNPKTATISDNHGVTALHRVVGLIYECYGMFSRETNKKKVFEFAQLLLENGADVNAEDENHHTPLMSAIKQTRDECKETMEMVKFLIAHGAKFYSESGYNVLCAATDSFEIMSYLLQQDSSTINLPDASGATPLHKLLSTFELYDLKMIDLLFSHGLDVSKDTKCIMVASEYNCRFKIIKTLIAHGAPFDCYTSFEKESFLREYCTSSEKVRKMLQLGTYPEDMNWTHVLQAVVEKCREGTLEAVKLLVAAGADPTFEPKCGEPLLYTACELYTATYNKDLIPLIEYLCSFSKYTDPNTKFEFDIYHPQIIILEHFHELHRPYAVRIMKSLLKTNFIDPKRSVPCALDFSIMMTKVFEPHFLTMLGSLFNIDDIRIILDDDTKILMQLMFDAGLKVPDAECDQVTTALTTLLTVKLPHTEDLYLQEDDDSLEDGSEQMEVTNSDTEEPGPDESKEDQEDLDDMEDNSSHQESDDDDEEESEDRLKVPDAREKVKELLELAKQFIESEVNVESMTLKLANTDTDVSRDYGSAYHREILRLEHALDELKNAIAPEGVVHKPETEMRMEFRSWSEPLRKKLWLPDALWVSFLSGNGPAVKMLLPYWSAPPLALLVFRPPHSLPQDLLSWYQLLSKYGGIPHGTEAYKRLASIIEDNMKTSTYAPNLAIYETVWTLFQKLHSSPLSLCTLSKYAVRAAYAERASKPDTSLPRIMTALSPPGLLAMLTQQD
ncbi:hypothetical protein B566_EDAN005215 [Ephemera danica]|nr:hypothetical protein B566_EDAN005215 [Ephemera danica]